MEDPLSPLNTSMQYPDHRLIEKERFLKLPANGGNTDPQHCCTNNNDNTVACCCVRVLQWNANGAVTLNNMQQPGSANGRKMEHPTMLPSFTRGLKLFVN